jgi:hypothetical protein
VRRCAWPGAASRYRPREKVPKNTFLEKPILTWPRTRVVYMPAALFPRGRTRLPLELLYKYAGIRISYHNFNNLRKRALARTS